MAAVFVVPAVAHATTRAADCNTRACVERVAARQCSNHHVVACIRRAAVHHRQPLVDAMRVARCESSLDPFNSYLGHFGLYQFLASTWASTPYRNHSVWFAKWNALAAMWMWRHHRRDEWACR